MFIDSHAHVDSERYSEDRAEVIARARDGGVELILNICNGDIEKGSLEAGLKLADQYEFIYAAVGVHPHEAKLYSDSLEQKLIDMSNHPRILAWGEVGLDYHYDHSPRDIQRQVFTRQLKLAHERGLPVIVHSREAEEDTIRILREEWGRDNRGGILHCFTGSLKMAEDAINLGFLISFSGVITFKNAQQLRDVAAALPMEKILIETDCPLLAPEPYRGRRNEPVRVREVARQIGALHGLSTEEAGQITADNFRRFFGLYSNLSGC